MTQQEYPCIREDTGRLPEKPGECVVLKTKTLTGVEEGDVIPLSAENDDLTDVLAVEGFTVVGLVETPYYMSIEKETSTVGAGHVQLTLYAGEDSFAYPAYTEANVLVKGAKALNAFTDEYEAAVDTVQNALEDLGKTQAVVRFEEVKGEAEDKLADGKEEYDKAKAEADEKLADARGELEDGRRELADGEKALSPGLKHKHYAPKAEVKVVLGPDDLRAQYILDSAAKDARPCVLCLEGRRGLYPGLTVLSAGNTPEDYAHNLFAALRHADEIGCTQVYAEGLSLEGVGLAVMNRVERAAGFHVIQL